MSAALELLRAAQEGDRDACEQAVIENNGLIWSVVRHNVVFFILLSSSFSFSFISKYLANPIFTAFLPSRVKQIDSVFPCAVEINPSESMSVIACVIRSIL